MNDKDLLNIANHKKIIYFENFSLLENYKLDLLNRMVGVWSDIYFSHVCYKIENNLHLDKYDKVMFCYSITHTDLDILNNFNDLKDIINNMFDCYRDSFEINRLILEDSVELLKDSMYKAFVDPIVVLFKRIYRNIEKGVRKIWDI